MKRNKNKNKKVKTKPKHFLNSSAIAFFCLFLFCCFVHKKEKDITYPSDTCILMWSLNCSIWSNFAGQTEQT